MVVFLSIKILCWNLLTPGRDKNCAGVSDERASSSSVRQLERIAKFKSVVADCSRRKRVV